MKCIIILVMATAAWLNVCGVHWFWLNLPVAIFYAIGILGMMEKGFDDQPRGRDRPQSQERIRIMLEQFVAKIASLASAAALSETPKVLSGFNSLRLHKYVTADGTIIDVPKEQPPHNETLATPGEFCKFVNAHAGNASVYLSFNSLIAVHDHDERIDRSSCDLKTTQIWDTVAGFDDATPTWFTQKEFRRLLRITLRAALPSSELINVISAIRFESGEAGSSVIGNGNNAISRDVRAQVTGQSAIPEEIRLVVPVWDNFAKIVQIDCAVEVCTDTKRFALIPFAGELAKAEAEALNAVRDFVADNLDENGDADRVFIGEP